METDYKTLQNRGTIEKFFDFAKAHFEELDEDSLFQKLHRANELINLLPQTTNFIRSPEYMQNVLELTDLVSKIDISEIDYNNLYNFFNYLMSITHQKYYHNFIQFNEKLFFMLVDLALSFMCQNHEIIMQLFNSGFLENVKFFLDYPHTIRKDKDVYEALIKALYNGAQDIQKRILDELEVQRFYILATSGLYTEQSNLLELVYKILALFVPPNLSDDEMTKCLKAYIYALERNISNVYSAISIGLYKKIENFKISSFRKDLIRPQILKIYYFLIFKMKNDQNPDLILTEYNFYISAKLLSNRIKINIDYNDFQSYISNDYPKIQIAAIYFFHSISEDPEILQQQGLDVIHFISGLNDIYPSSSFGIKIHLNKLIFAYLKFSQVADLFEILQNGFMETLIQVIQTFTESQIKNGELFELLLFLNSIFETSEELFICGQLSNQFWELGGFDVLQEFIDDPKYPLVKENEQIPSLCEHLIERYKPEET